MKFRKKLRKSAAEVIIIIIVGVVGLLTLSSYYVSSLTPFSQWFLAITPLAVAFATFYLSVSITRDRRAREMAERVYTFLLKEVTTWLDPESQTSGEWTRLKLEVPYWFRRVPKDIATLFNHAYDLFQARWRLRTILDKLISDAIDRLSKEVLAKAGHNTNDPSANIQFNIMTESGVGVQPIWLIWLWLSGKSVSEYLNDLSRKLHPPGSKWTLQTLVSPKTGGETKEAGGKENTMKWIGKIMESVEAHPEALAYRRQIREIMELGERALLLIEEELA